LRELKIPVFMNASKHKGRVAIVDDYGSHQYNDLLQQSANVAAHVRGLLEKRDTGEQKRIAFLCPNDYRYVVVQWACWMLGHIAVPLAKMYPTELLKYFISDSDSEIVICTEEFKVKIETITEAQGRTFLLLDDVLRHNETGSSEIVEGLHEDSYQKTNALIVYTSGTTGPPKGVLLSHVNLQAQMNALVAAWGWTAADSILHVLPLHHLHGIMNALMCPLYVGAKCVMLPNFDVAKVLDTLMGQEQVTVFMAVPTIYIKLIEECQRRYEHNPHMKDVVRSYLTNNMRLMVSGSASLPVPIFNKWRDMTGHTLLERYGMSEVGMALSNLLHGPRVSGSVGNPLPGVEVRICKMLADGQIDLICEGNDQGSTVTPGREGESGELFVRGKNVFKEYWRKPGVTRESFTQDGWFHTGDTALYSDGRYRILGRTSVDIIKSGGCKISALDVEAYLLSHPDIAEAVVVGLPDPTWGERVAAVIRVNLSRSHPLTLTEVRDWGRNKMPPYSLPKQMKIVSAIPKSAIGKVNKKEIVQEMFPESRDASGFR